ncbi:hypothetical protein NDU88_003794 [Pleurodeles waltl]|uniref:Uncharacterized protein n=1 Tax=Pleurodeles waltl TaxID=8319 RepID=A0AAV7RH83_PLEWA|nr:hypothetical protein NDU88_003794 [Pleurodeles waltl]
MLNSGERRRAPRRDEEGPRTPSQGPKAAVWKGRVLLHSPKRPVRPRASPHLPAGVGRQHREGRLLRQHTEVLAVRGAGGAAWGGLPAPPSNEGTFTLSGGARVELPPPTTSIGLGSNAALSCTAGEPLI